MTAPSSSEAKDLIRAEARARGFDVCRFARADAPWTAGAHLERYIELGRHGEMDWMARTAERRAHPTALWDEARSALVLGLNYGPDENPLEALTRPREGAVSVYARGEDYHDIIKGRLKTLGGWLQARFGGALKVFVDTAPLMEKPLAQAAGLGWQGKHTNLVSREFGSWMFLGVVLTSLELDPDPPETDHCGTCRRCLDVCPTGAFPAPYELDARLCISYLTIELKGPVPRALRPALGNRIYGCDDCLSVCPWNRFASAARDQRLASDGRRGPSDLERLAGLDEAEFRKTFAKTAVKRTGRERFVRNVLYAIGNSGARDLAPAAEARLGDPSPLVRGAAVWALARLLPVPELRALALLRTVSEPEAEVLEEWRLALAGPGAATVPAPDQRG